MSTNLSPEAKKAEQEYHNANTLEEKIEKLERYIALIPKHKATEKMVARLKSTLVKHKNDLVDRKERQKLLVKGPAWIIAKEGDAQIALVGIANSGKSLIVKNLTGANTKVADYPFATEKPEPGVLDYGGAIIQLIDLPSIFPNIRLESKNGPKLFSQIRGADLLLLVIDLSQNPKDQMEILLKELNEGDLRVNKERPPIEIKKTGSGGTLIFGEEKINVTKKEVIEILNEQNLYNVHVKINKQITLADLVEALDTSIIYCKGLIVANKGDLPGSKENFDNLVSLYADKFDIVPISALKGEGLELLKDKIFEKLNLMRIRSKEPNGKVATKPIVLKNGATVGDVAKIIHSRFFEYFKQAKIYGPSAKFEGQSVGINHVLKDGDIVEIFAD